MQDSERTAGDKGGDGVVASEVSGAAELVGRGEGVDLYCNFGLDTEPGRLMTDLCLP